MFNLPLCPNPEKSFNSILIEIFSIISLKKLNVFFALQREIFLTAISLLFSIDVVFT